MKILKNQVIGLSHNSKLLKQYKESLTNLSIIQWECAIGLLLGDASLQTQNNGKTFRIKFEWGDKNKAYLQYVYNIFDEWVLSEPHKKSRVSPKGNLVVNYGFQTISHEAFNFLAELFYSGSARVKSISPNLIQDHLTARGLAHWFSDDGGKLDYNLNSKNNSIVLNTHSFNNLEVENLAKELASKFTFICETRFNKNKKIIIIKSEPRRGPGRVLVIGRGLPPPAGESYLLFKNLIFPYLIPEMYYKLPMGKKYI